MAQLSVNQVSIAYERISIVSNITFEIEKGDYLCILGENGSGKSTLVKGILGLVAIQGGSVVFGDEAKRNQVGYLPQKNSLQRDFPASVFEVVLSGCLGSLGRSPFYAKKEKDRAMLQMKRLGIETLKNSSYRKLSGGQQQRVLLARALCATEDIIFLDEPINGLDPAASKEFYKLIEEINRRDHISVVMVSHDISMALASANKVLYIGSEGSFFGTREEYEKSSQGRKFLAAGNGKIC